MGKCCENWDTCWPWAQKATFLYTVAFVLPADDSGEVSKAAMLRMSLYLKVFYVLLAPMEIISTP